MSMLKYIILSLMYVPTLLFGQLIEEKNNLRFLALGDSYTIGQSVVDTARWPNQLADSLTQKYALNYDEVTIIAKTGWRTDNLSNGIITQQPDSNYDMVSLLIGVNNFYQGKAVANYIVEFEELLQWSIALAKGDTQRVFVVSIPDYAYTPFGKGNTNISKGIDLYNHINDSITSLYDIDYYDITPISREGLNDTELVATDGLHPSGKQYSQWVSLMLESISPIESVVTNTLPIETTDQTYMMNEDSIRGKKLFLYDQQGRVLVKNASVIYKKDYPKGIYILQYGEGVKTKVLFE